MKLQKSVSGHCTTSASHPHGHSWGAGVTGRGADSAQQQQQQHLDRLKPHHTHAHSITVLTANKHHYCDPQIPGESEKQVQGQKLKE